ALNNEPIHARPVGVFERAQLWRKRNSGLVASVFFLSTIALLVAFEYYRQGKNAEIHSALRERSILDKGNEIVSESKSRERELSKQVRALANSAVFEVTDALDSIPGTGEGRKLLLERGLESLKTLAENAEDESGLQIELALAYVRLGRFQSKREGELVSDKIGADKSFRRALEILSSLKERSGRDYLHAYGLAKVQLANLYYSDRRHSDAERELDEGTQSPGLREPGFSQRLPQFGGGHSDKSNDRKGQGQDPHGLRSP
ncbi:MAG: hypothetical protein P1V97_33440, partial [Planctomycetota bacterium]|nr:hypothetical protein [Planctomycetota bacterium]